MNGNTVSNEIELPVAQQGANAVQVLTSPINGQFYVIGNANDVFTTSQTSRSLAPRATTLQIETPRNSTPGLKKVKQLGAILFLYYIIIIIHLIII